MIKYTMMYMNNVWEDFLLCWDDVILELVVWAYPFKKSNCWLSGRSVSCMSIHIDGKKIWQCWYGSDTPTTKDMMMRWQVAWQQQTWHVDWWGFLSRDWCVADWWQSKIGIKMTSWVLHLRIGLLNPFLVGAKKTRLGTITRVGAFFISWCWL